VSYWWRHSLRRLVPLAGALTECFSASNLKSLMSRSISMLWEEEEESAAECDEDEDEPPALCTSSSQEVPLAHVRWLM
jgi:hypothetical protein